MLALGVLLLSAAVGAVLALRALFTRTDAPRWTRVDLVGELVAVAITALFGFGMITTGIGLVDLSRGGSSFAREVLPALVAVALIAGLVWFVRQRPRRGVTIRPAH